MATEGAPVIDTRVLGKPKTYSGIKDEFATWKYQTLNYLGALSGDLMESAMLAEGEAVQAETPRETPLSTERPGRLGKAAWWRPPLL